MSFSEATFSVLDPMVEATAVEAIDNSTNGTKVKTEPVGSVEPAIDSPVDGQGRTGTSIPPQQTHHTAPENTTGDAVLGGGDGDTNMTGTEPPRPTTQAAPVRKKKGMATAVKAPKKGRLGGKKAKSAPKKKGAAASSPTTAGRPDDGDAADDGDDAADGDSGSEESDHGPYCVCRGPDDHRWMIQCDGCEDWFHGECVHITKEVGETLIQSYVCPNCTDDAARYVTRYKKTCSLAGCLRPARVYAGPDAAAAPDRSVFCGPDHAHAWWEQLVAALPRARARDNDLQLSQEEFMGLLAGSAVDGAAGWKLGDTPFGIPPDFWEVNDPAAVLTDEETAIVTTSTAERHRAAQEIGYCQKMLTLLDLANDRHRAAVAATAIEKDACGYDFRLDDVGASAQFARFLTQPEGLTIFPPAAGDAATPAPTPAPPPAASASRDSAPRLGAPVTPAADRPADLGSTYAADHARSDGMCRRRKCKPHAGWYVSHARHVRYMTKELAREAADRLGRETSVRRAAAQRFLRRGNDNAVVVWFPESGDDGGGEGLT